MVNKFQELAKSDFIKGFSTLPQLDVNSMYSIMQYMKSLDNLLEDLYNAGYKDGFQKATEIDVKQN